MRAVLVFSFLCIQVHHFQQFLTHVTSTSTSSLALDFLDPPSLDGLLEPLCFHVAGHLLGCKTAILTDNRDYIFAVVPDFRINDMRLASFFKWLCFEEVEVLSLHVLFLEGY